MNITEQELLNAIQAAMTASPENPSGAMTTADLSDALNIGDRKVLALMKSMIAAGDVEIVTIYRENIFGVVRKMNAFKLK